MKTIELKKLQDLEDFFEANKKFKFKVVCRRELDDYHIKIQAYSSISNNEAMMIFNTVESVLNIAIHIDSMQLNEAYNNLDENEKIPPQHDIDNLSASHNGDYMRYLVICSYKQIMDNLKAFNGIKDDYCAIAKLARIKRGGVFGFISGTDKEEII